MDPTIRLPRVDEQDAAGEAVTVVEPKNAASIILIRAGGDTGRGSIESHLLKRHSRMAFAPDAVVFPGGGVDVLDLEPASPWQGPAVDAWASDLGVDASTAASVVMAAARETFEETGVLLAAHDSGELVSETEGDDWEADRQALLARDLSFARLLSKRGLTLRTDLLRVWSKWTTPEFEPRRYRTWFFIALVPAGQTTRDISGETVSSEWRSVRSALVDADAGALRMLPPQYCSLLDLFAFESPAAAMATPRELEDIRPGVLHDADGAYLRLPQRFIDLGLAVGAELGAS